MIDSYLTAISNNKLFGGCILLLTNIGGKYIALDMPDNIEKLFSKYFILRCLVLFSVLFMSTRDIKISILLSLLFFIITRFFVNEKSSFCLINTTNDNNIKISEKDYKNAIETINNYNA